MKRFCPFCGKQIDSASIFCLYCGKKIPEEAKHPLRSETRRHEMRSPIPASTPHSIPYHRPDMPRVFLPTQQASIGDRCLALLMDNCISYGISIVSCYFICFPLGFVYDCLKDGIRNGRSLGKGGMNLRVVDFRTGRPATIGQSMIRNCFCGGCDSSTCYCFAFMDSYGRRIGDKVAGTIVIKDY